MALSAEVRARLAEILSRSVGSHGLVAGQEQDLKWLPELATREDVALVHARKTAALFSAAASMGAVAASGERGADRDCWRDFGEKLGLAFQILDDLLDATASRESAGKDVGQDGGRPSLVLTIGLEAAWREAQVYIDEASSLISGGGGGEAALRHFAMGLVAGLENKLDTHARLCSGRCPTMGPLAKGCDMPDWLIGLGVFLAVFLGMEGVAWAMHKYVMHGGLWVLHESHHRPRRSWFELNDLFGFFFTLVSIGLVLAGTLYYRRCFRPAWAWRPTGWSIS